MIKNIIFDFDGVLVDSEILAAKAFSRYMTKFGVNVDEKEFAIYAGNKTINVIETVIGRVQHKGTNFCKCS